MAGGIRDHRGGIVGLAELIRSNGEAIEFELLTRGLHLDRLGTKHLTWRDLKVLVRHLPPGNALQRERHGDAAYWTIDTYLLALIGDALQGANWQRAGDKHATRPKPIPRPELGQPTQPNGRRVGDTGGVSIDVMKQRLGWE